jgi:hypothetical protein
MAHGTSLNGINEGPAFKYVVKTHAQIMRVRDRETPSYFFWDVLLLGPTLVATPSYSFGRFMNAALYSQ